MQPDLLLDVARRTLGPGTPVHGSLRNAGWFVAEDIPEKKLTRAREAYAPYDPAAETPVLLYDLTIFGSAKRGLLLTTGALYYAMTSAVDGFSEVTGRIATTRIQRLAMVDAELHVNEEAVGRLIRPDREDGRALATFFQQIEEASSGLAPVIGTGELHGRAVARWAPDEIFAAIRGLKALYDEDALTHDEFQAKKQELLGRL